MHGKPVTLQIFQILQIQVCCTRCYSLFVTIYRARATPKGITTRPGDAGAHVDQRRIKRVTPFPPKFSGARNIPCPCVPFVVVCRVQGNNPPRRTNFGPCSRAAAGRTPLVLPQLLRESISSTRYYRLPGRRERIKDKGR